MKWNNKRNYRIGAKSKKEINEIIGRFEAKKRFGHVFFFGT
jgi:hypothetical protein